MPPPEILIRAKAADYSRPHRRGHACEISFLTASEILDYQHGCKAWSRYR